MKQSKIVIDTNILISALRSRQGASARLLSLVGTGLFEVHVSIPLILEYEEVLSKHKTFLGLSQDDLEDLLDALCALAVRHPKVHFRWRPFLPDPKDEFILDLAVLAQSNYIITYNEKDFAGAERFGIQITDPKTFLQTIGVIT